MQLAPTAPRSVVAWTAQSAQLTVRRAIALARLGPFVDRLPGGRRTAARSARAVEAQEEPR